MRFKLELRPTLSCELILVDVTRVMADCRDLDEVLAATVDNAVRADDGLTDVVAPELGDHAPRVREAAQGSDLLEQLLEPAAM